MAHTTHVQQAGDEVAIESVHGGIEIELSSNWTPGFVMTRFDVETVEMLLGAAWDSLHSGRMHVDGDPAIEFDGELREAYRWTTERASNGRHVVVELLVDPQEDLLLDVYERMIVELDADAILDLSLALAESRAYLYVGEALNA